MTTTPHAELPPLPKVGPICHASVVDVETYAPFLKCGPHLPGVRDVALWSTDQMRAYATSAIERALLARLGEQQPVCWAVGLPGEPIKQQALWTAKPTFADARCATTQGGLPLPVLVVTPLYTQPAVWPVSQAEEGGVDCIGLALDLEAQARRVESQTVERAMNAAAHGLRLLASRSSAQGAAQVPPDITAAVRDVLAECERQVEVEGFDARHDDENQHEEMAFAAACYVTADEGEAPPAVWPWGLKWWKPKGRRTNLVKAAALTIAEIERLDRANTKEPQA